jgi:hypothetical protein
MADMEAPERIYVCEECGHVFSQHDMESEDGAHPCFSQPRSKKPWMCESYRKRFIADIEGSETP